MMPLQNTTGVGLNSLMTFGDWIPTLIIVITCALIVGIFVFAYGSFSRYKKLRGFLGFIGKTCIYFGKGLVGVAVFGSIVAGAWLFGTSVSEGVIRLDIIASWIGLGIAGFFGIAGFGYVLDKLWKRMKRFKKRYKDEKKE